MYTFCDQFLVDIGHLFAMSLGRLCAFFFFLYNHWWYLTDDPLILHACSPSLLLSDYITSTWASTWRRNALDVTCSPVGTGMRCVCLGVCAWWCRTSERVGESPYLHPHFNLSFSNPGWHFGQILLCNRGKKQKKERCHVSAVCARGRNDPKRSN